MRSVGLDVGGTKVLGLLVEADGRVAGRLRRPAPDDGASLIDTLADMVVELAGQDPVPVGVGVPGLVDRTGRLHAAPNLKGSANLSVGERLAEHLGRPVVVDNDATAAAWGEHVAGAGRGADDMLMLTLGTGVGGGLVIGGVIQRGAHGFGGETGHLVVDPSGPLCPCGRRGCWERYVSGSGLAWLAGEAVAAGAAPDLAARSSAVGHPPRAEDVIEAARVGAAEALAIVDTFANWLGLGLANLITLLDPERIVLGGGLAEAADVWLHPARVATEAHLGTGYGRPLDVVVAQLGNDAGAIGAAALASEAVTA